MRLLVATVVAFSAVIVSSQNIKTTVETLQDIYHQCSDAPSMLTCVKPKVLFYINEAIQQEKLPVTNDLTIVRSFNVQEEDSEDHYASQSSLDPEQKKVLRSLMLEKLDTYLSSHYIEAKLPEAIAESKFIPRSLIDSLPRKLSVSLSETPKVQGRGFVKKVVIPFLLGLKFKATAVAPLALALIALKTWKALTLGLLSIVLSGALLIFKLTKPKVAYEVVHYGHPPVETPPHWEASANGPYRAYRAYRR